MSEALNKSQKQKQDGRSRRRASSRRAILDALLGFYSEGVIDPTAQQVADRAGVSRRTVFGLFQDLNSLMVELVDRHLESTEQTAGLPDAGGGLSERIERLVDRRERYFQEVSTILRVVRSQGYKYPALLERTRQERSQARLRMLDYFAPEFQGLAEQDREDLATALMIQFHFDSWHQLSSVQELATGDRRRLWITTIASLFEHFLKKSDRPGKGERKS